MSHPRRRYLPTRHPTAARPLPLPSSSSWLSPCPARPAIHRWRCWGGWHAADREATSPAYDGRIRPSEDSTEGLQSCRQAARMAECSGHTYAWGAAHAHLQRVALAACEPTSQPGCPITAVNITTRFKGPPAASSTCGRTCRRAAPPSLQVKTVQGGNQ